MPELGEGWTKITAHYGPHTSRPGQVYHQYLSPRNKIRFQSLLKAKRFVAALESIGVGGDNGDNEKKALKALDNDNKALKAAYRRLPKYKTKKNVDVDDDDDPQPKRPFNTYLMYTAELRPKITAENPDKSSVEISKILGQFWKEVPTKTKDKLTDKYAKEMKVYLEEVKQWELRNPVQNETKHPNKGKRKNASPGGGNSGASPTPRKKSRTNAKGGGGKGKRKSKNKSSDNDNDNDNQDDNDNENDGENRRRTSARDTKSRNGAAHTESEEGAGQNNQRTASSSSSANTTICRREGAPAEGATSIRHTVLVEDDTWNWDDASQVRLRSVQRISVHDTNARDLVTEARIQGTPLVLTGHVGWANFAKRWLRRRRTDPGPVANESNATIKGDNKPAETTQESGSSPNDDVLMEVPGKESNDDGQIDRNGGSMAKNGEAENGTNPEREQENGRIDHVEGDRIGTIPTEESEKPLDLSDPSWYLDIEAMSKDIGDEEVPVVKKNYNESKPISGNILASNFLEVGWKNTKNKLLSPRKKRKSSMLYLHQWQFPLSVEACKKLCHQSVPLPNNILGEDLLKYWLDMVKLDSPLQYLFMGKADTMSRIHRDNGGLAISIAPITGAKECVLVHRDDGHACLYHNQAGLDACDIDLNAYPLLPHARIWKTTIRPGEILLMPHGTYHQCRNLSPCLSYSRFHLDGVNLRAFLQSMMDGDAPELNQDEVIWNATRELIDVVDTATDEKREVVDNDLFKAVDALRALRNIAKEVNRKLQIRQTVKGTNPSAPVVCSTVKIDGDAEIWQSLVDDVDVCLHEFRYRFNQKIPSFKRKRSIGRKILAMPALPFRGKAKPSDTELYQGRNEPVVAFECPSDRSFLSLPKADAPDSDGTITPERRKLLDESIASIAAGDEIDVRIEGRKCPAVVTEVYAEARAAWMSFEDLPSLYNDFVLLDHLRLSSVAGSCLVEPKPEDIEPGKLLVCHMGRDEYRGVVQFVKTGPMFRSKLDFGNGHKVDKLVDSDSILSVTRQA
eukprot:jgi/Psemu1/219700/e_gw1.988.10.1